FVDPVVSPRMRSVTQSLLVELQKAPLLGQIGQSHTLPHPSVGSWREALELCHSETWDALQLMTKNRDADVVNRLNWDRCQGWNAVCADLRIGIDETIQASLHRVCETHKVTTNLQGTMSWDMLGILLEREFDDVTPPVFYIPVLL